MEYKIRRAVLSDLERIQNLNYELFVHDSTFDSALFNNWPYSKDGETYFKKAIKSKGRKYLCLIAETDGKTVGYLVGLVWKTWRSRPAKTAELDNMLLLSEYRGKGIGKRLVDSFVNWCKTREITSILVMAYTQNVGAVDFYEKIGFKPLSQRLELKLR